MVVAGLLEGDMGEFDSFDDLIAVGLEGEVAVENDTEVGKFGDFSDGETRGGEGEVSWEEPRSGGSGAALEGGLVEDDNFGFE